MLDQEVLSMTGAESKYGKSCNDQYGHKQRQADHRKNYVHEEHTDLRWQQYAEQFMTDEHHHPSYQGCFESPPTVLIAQPLKASRVPHGPE